MLPTPSRGLLSRRPGSAPYLVTIVYYSRHRGAIAFTGPVEVENLRAEQGSEQA